MGFNFGQWAAEVGQNVGNDVLGRVSEEFGGPQLPPLQFVDQHTNNNAYVQPRPAPDAPAESFVDQAINNKKTLILYGSAAVAVFVVLALLLRRK